MFPTISIGPAVIPTAPLTIILGLWVSLSLVERATRALKGNVALTYGLASTGLVAGILAARLTFVALHWSAYQDNLWGVIWPINSGFNLGGGLIVGVLAAFFYGRARQLPPGPLLDALIPGIVAALIFVSLADFLAGPGYGDTTTMPWGVSQFGVRRHPVQLYEIIVGLTALAVWWGSLPPRRFPGYLFLLTTSVYSLGRLLVDAFRANAWLTRDGFHMLQIVALFVTLLCLALIAHYSRRPAPGN